jgi:hypothetical protein
MISIYFRIIHEASFLITWKIACAYELQIALRTDYLEYVGGSTSHGPVHST